MQALVLKDFGTMAVEERPEPSPGRGEALLATLATGICGSDLHGFTGANGRRVPGQIMGHETVAHVVALGPGGSSPDPGAVVTVNPVVIPEEDAAHWAGREHHHPAKYVIGVAPNVVSAFAQLVVVPSRNVIALPEGMPVYHGALVEPVAVAVHAVGRVAAEHPTSALVVGGGPIGQSLVLVLRQSGIADVLVSELDPARRELVEMLGARTLDPAAGALAEQVGDALGGLAEVAFDAVGASTTISDALAATRLGGSVCLVGMASPRVELDAFAVSTQERALVGSFTYSAANFGRALELVAADPQVAAALISRVVPLAEGPAAFSSLAHGDGTPGKVLIKMQP
jgi:L-iditol 2-dehydrogenase